MREKSAGSPKGKHSPLGLLIGHLLEEPHHRSLQKTEMEKEYSSEFYSLSGVEFLKEYAKTRPKIKKEFIKTAGGSQALFC